MEIYLSSETEGRADSLLLPIRNMVDSPLDDIRKNEYGSALTSVGVFAIIMKEEMYDSGGYCERQYYSKVRKEADIRLRLNYKSFCNAEPEKRVATRPTRERSACAASSSRVTSSTSSRWGRIASTTRAT